MKAYNSIILVLFLLPHTSLAQIQKPIVVLIDKNKISPNAPTQCIQANAGPDISICPNSSAVIGTPAIPGYTYSWNPIFGLSDPNIAQPTVIAPSTATTYTVTITNQANVIANGNFENGFTDFQTDYGNFPIGSCDRTISYGSLRVGTNPINVENYWCDKHDHTTHSGKMLIVDGNDHLCPPINNRVWYETVNVNQNTTYYFSGFAASSNPSDNNQPFLRVNINGNPIIQNFTFPYFDCSEWYQMSASWYSGTNNTALIEIYDDRLAGQQNDFCLDDLYMGICPQAIDEVVVSPVTPPTIIQAYVDLGWGTIIPLFINGYNHYCEIYEGGGYIHAISNSPGTWLVDDAPITPSVGTIISPTEMIINTGGSIHEYKIQIQSNRCGDNSISLATYSRKIATPINSPGQYNGGGWFKPNSTTRSGDNVYDQGPFSIYTWSIPDVTNAGGTIIPVYNQYSPAVYVTFPSYNPIPATINGTLTVTSSYCDNTYPYIFIYNPNVHSVTNNQQKITISPNPTTSHVTITAQSIIQSLEIYSIFSSQMLKIPGNGSKSLVFNLPSLKAGIYTCRIIMSNEIILKKLIIKN